MLNAAVLVLSLLVFLLCVYRTKKVLASKASPTIFSVRIIMMALVWAGGEGKPIYTKFSRIKKTIPISSVADPAGPDPGSRIPNPYFLELSDKCLVKKSYNSLKIGPHFFLQHFKNKIIFNFVKFVATKKGMRTNFFSPLPFVEVFGSGIRDPRSGILVPGWVRNHDPR